MDDTIYLGADQPPAVRVSRRYNHPLDRVWSAVTMPEHLATWFPSEVAIDLQPGGEVRYLSFEGDAALGKVLELETGRRLVLDWAGDRLTFELAADGEGTLFTLTHEFADRYGAASFATGWETCMESLRASLEGDDAHPPSMTERHEELVVRFGLDRPQVSRSDDGWSVRFERQLTCPAQAAWDHFIGTDPQTGAQRSAPGPGDEFTPSSAPDVTLGTVTERDEPRLFAFEAPRDEPGDRVRLELGEGTGQGARLILEIRGVEESELDAAVLQWSDAVAHVAREAVRLASSA